MFFWVHTCPKRREEVQGTIRSLDRSDVRSYEVWEHPEAFRTSEEIELWWEQRLLKAAKRGEYFVRLEDDTEVSPTIQHRLLQWGAIHQPDFAVGVLYQWEGSPRGEGTIDRSGRYPRIVDPRHMGAPGMVFRSEYVMAVVEEMRNLRMTRQFSRGGLLNFDTVVGQACQRLGLSVYLHEPSLVDCREAESVNQPGAARHLPARNFAET